MKQFFILFFVFFTVRSSAEVLNGSTLFSDTVNGKIMFVLYDNIEITSTDFQNGWCIAGIEVIVNINLMKDTGEWIMPKGMKLINWKGKEVGEILNDYVFYLGYEGRNAKEQTVLITGYTLRTSIRKNSIVESRITEAIGQKEKVVLQDLKNHIDEFRYQIDGQFHGFRSYFYNENIIETYAPIDRIRFIFKDNVLICIIHTRKLECPNTTDYLQPKYHFLFYNFVDAATKEKLINDYNRFFKTIEL